MVTYGFYNSVDHDRTYDATQVSELFDGLIEPGIYNSIGQRFKVEAVSNSFQVRVGTGRAWFNHTWTKNDAPLILNLPAPPTMADRYRSDAIVIDINSDIKVRENKITYVCGEESASEDPPHPTLSTGTHTQVPLAYIRRGAKNAKETSIDPLQINYVVGTDDGPPWVVGVLQSVDISVYVGQWETAWNAWFADKQHAVDNAIADVNANKAAFKAYVTEQISELSIWMSDKREDFDDWFATIRNILDSNAAGHLQLEIEALSERITPIEYGGTGNDHGHIQSGAMIGNTYDASTSGQYATAEGMFTHAAGICSHAEGGGELNEVWHDEELYSDRLLQTNGTLGSGITLTGNGSSFQMSSELSSSYTRTPLLDISGYEFKVNQYTASKNVKSVYIAAVLKNETTGEILKHDIGCIGPDVTSKGKYIGNIPNLDDISNNAFPYIGKSGISLSEKKDIGYLKPQYNLGFGRYEVVNVGMSYKTNGDSGTNTVTVGNGLWKSITVCTEPRSSDKADYVLYKENVVGKPTSDSLNIHISKSLQSVYGGYINIDINIIVKMTRYDAETGGYTYPTSGDTMTYTWNITRSDSVDSDSYILPIYIVFGRNLYTEEELIPHENGGSSYWYMNGTTPENSSILVDNSLCCGFALYSGTYSGTTYTNAPGLELSNRDPALIATPLSPHIILKNKTDTYSLKFYYTYTTMDDEVNHEIEWIPAGYTKQGIGLPTRALGNYSHAEGYGTKANGSYSHAEGYVDTEEYTSESNDYPGAYGQGSHVEGYNCRTFSAASHAEGWETKVYGAYAHAEGYKCEVQYDADPHSVDMSSGAHAEGYLSIAKGNGAHAEGTYSKALASNSHAGAGGTASLIGQFVHGIFGFGGIMEDVTESVTYERTNSHINGCYLHISSSKTVTFITNEATGNPGIPKILLVTMAAKYDDDIEVDIIRIYNDTAAAPQKIQIARSGSHSSSCPVITTTSQGMQGSFTIPSWTVDKYCQIIRIM